MGKTTISYTLALYAATTGLVLLMSAVAGVGAWHDARTAKRAQIDDRLQAAIQPAADAVRRHFEPTTLQMEAIQHWVSGGIIPDSTTHRWPAYVLPAVAPLAPVRTVWLAKENGTCWRWVRDGDHWVGEYTERRAESATVARSLWHKTGEWIPGETPAASPASPDTIRWLDALLRESAALDGPLTIDSISTERSRVCMAVPLEFPSDQGGILAFEVEYSAVLAQLLQQSNDAIQLYLDPGGTQASKLQDGQTLALLTERAVPLSANAALSTWMSKPSDIHRAQWYRGAQISIGRGPAWWVIASVDADAITSPIPVGRALLPAMVVGILGAAALAYVLGRRMTRPIAQVAARARNIQAVDEHYVPWPHSRFTEVNRLTEALEGIYESAVEHLDYHDAPLVVWAQDNSDPDDNSIVVDAVRHVVNIPRGNGTKKDPAPAEEAPITVASGAKDIIAPPAAQLQVLNGTRREVRRLQGQLSGASAELRTTSARYEEGQERMRRQRNCLRSLHKALISEGVVSLEILQETSSVLGAGRVSLWIAIEKRHRFRLRVSTGEAPEGTAVLEAGFRFQGLLEGESSIAVVDSQGDDRLQALTNHAYFRGAHGAMLLAPIKLGGQLLGFLLAEHRGGPYRWKSDEDLFLTSIAAQCAGTLWQQMRQRQRSVAQAHLAQDRANGHENEHGQRNGNTVPVSFGDRTPDVEIRWETDLAGCIRRVDGNVFRLYGRHPSQLLGQPITFLSEPKQAQDDLNRLSALLSGHQCTGYHTSHHAADGTTVELFIEGEIARDASDRIVGARGTARLVRATAGV